MGFCKDVRRVRWGLAKKKGVLRAIRSQLQEKKCHEGENARKWFVAKGHGESEGIMGKGGGCNRSREEWDVLGGRGVGGNVSRKRKGVSSYFECRRNGNQKRLEDG